MDFEGFWHAILSVVSESGVWAVLFVSLSIILINANNKREEKYQEIIRALASSLKKLEEVKEDIEDIKFFMGIGGNSNIQKKTNTEDENESERKSKNI